MASRSGCGSDTLTWIQLPHPTRETTGEPIMAAQQEEKRENKDKEEHLDFYTNISRKKSAFIFTRKQKCTNKNKE